MSDPSVPDQAMRSATKSKLQHVLTNDPFPIDLFYFIHAVPSEEDEDSEPPKKRVRTEPAEAIVIGRDTFTISRPSQPEVAVTETVMRVNVHRHVKVVHNEARHILTVSSIPRSPYGSFKSEISLGILKLSPTATAILDVLSHSKDDQSEDGALWVSVMIELERIEQRDEIRFYLELNWNSSTDIMRSQRHLSSKVINAFLPPRTRDIPHEKLSPGAFYEVAFISEHSHSDPFSLKPPGLLSTLFPFQRRALQWLLNREGVEWKDECANGKPGLELLSESPTSELPLSFQEYKDAYGQSIYISDLYHVANRSIVPFRKAEAAIRGGILAEEMGLGKTVETIALICTHTRKNSPTASDAMPQGLIFSGATLIVTPLTLKAQWESEFEKHAPHLNVITYDGLKGYDGYSVANLAKKDVVITTYNVLQAEIYYAEQAPDRSLRHEKKYERPKSPLMQISWWRVCLDEAQQIESGVSNAAKVARWIPRLNAWGITGTPVKENIKDLWGLLVFLRYEPFASSTPIWEGLITSHQHLFGPLFNRIALRHTKSAVRSELTLPHQNRHVVTIPFTTVEEQRYREQFASIVATFTRDPSGESLRANWDNLDQFTISSMQSALSSLRQATLHPALGPARLAGGVYRKKPLQNVDDVLDAMIEQSKNNIRTRHRNLLLHGLKVGQILEGQSKVDEAIKVWKEALGAARDLVSECRQQLQEELDKAQQTDANGTTSQQNEGEPEEESIPGRIGDYRRKLRTVLDVLHRALFFIASGYYQLKVSHPAPNSKEAEELEAKEVSGYEEAKSIRQEILQEPHVKVTSSIAKIRDKAKSQSFVEIPAVKFPAYHGLESRKSLESFQMLAEALNNQAGFVDELREAIVQMLMRPLVDEEDETEITGEEYEDSTKLQDDLMAYTLALRAAIADRQDAVSGLQNERIKYDTRFAEQQARNGQGHAPQKVIGLLRQRHELKPDLGLGSFRGIVTSLRELATKLRHEADSGKNRAKVELEIVESQLRLVQDHSTAQSKSAIALETELATFVAATNARVEYYKQLQVVSDTVAPLEADKVGMEELEFARRTEARLRREYEDVLPKHRYLLHIKKSEHKEEEVCVICQAPFTLGTLTPCGHLFCRDCILHWLKNKTACPVCKTYVSASMLHDITYKKLELKIRQELPERSQHHSREPGATSSPSASRISGIYSEFSKEKLEAINSIALPVHQNSAKIRTLIKHLMWLRVEDPGAKAVIFSQFPRFLNILAEDLRHHQIGHTSFKTRNGIKKFIEDPAIECFLMDARAHASGLNLVNASHVFLCEPLLNTALELQAIARVDRIGQEHDTTVWLYLIEGTVEESIYNLSVQRRLEHLRSNDAKGKSKELAASLLDLRLEAANSRELEQASLPRLMNKDLRLGEVVPVDDLWQCLFGHVAKEKEREAHADDALRNNPAVMGFLAGEAAEARRSEAEAE